MVTLQQPSPFKLQPSLQLQIPFFPFPSNFANCQTKITNVSISCLKIPCNSHNFNGARIRSSVPLTNEIPPNALRRKEDPLWRCGFSLGVDLGLSHTGLALSKGFSFRPLTVILGFSIFCRLIQFSFSGFSLFYVLMILFPSYFQVLNLRGEKLELSLIDIAEKEVLFMWFYSFFLFFFFKLMFDFDCIL